MSSNNSASVVRDTLLLHSSITTAPVETKGFKLNHTCLRIRDPIKSLSFYMDVLGLHRLFSMNAGPFTVYYLGYFSQGETRGAEVAKKQPEREGLLELIHVHDQTESSENNTLRNWGFAHIGIFVPDVKLALARFKQLEVKVVKPLGVCTMETFGLPPSNIPIDEVFANAFRQIVMIEDPDGYAIEILPQVIELNPTVKVDVEN